MAIDPNILQIISGGYQQGNQALSNSLNGLNQSILANKELKLKETQLGMEQQEIDARRKKEEAALAKQERMNKIIAESFVGDKFDPIGASNSLYASGFVPEAQNILKTHSEVTKEAAATRKTLTDIRETDREEVRKRSKEVATAFGPVLAATSPEEAEKAWQAAILKSANSGLMKEEDLAVLSKARTTPERIAAAQQQLLKAGTVNEQLDYITSQKNRELEELKFRLTSENGKEKGSDINTSDELFTSIILKMSENQRNNRDPMFGLAPAETEFYTRRKQDPALGIVTKLIESNLEFGLTLLKDRNKAAGMIRDFRKTIDDSLFEQGKSTTAPTAIPSLDNLNKALKAKGYDQVTMEQLQARAKERGTTVEIVIKSISKAVK